MMNNTDGSRWQVFLDSMLDMEVADEALRLKAESEDIPIIRTETEYFLRWLLNTIKPSDILEIGTAVGYSAIVMLRELQEAHVTTIESYEVRSRAAKSNFESHGLTDRITLYEDDAVIRLKELTGPYDFIFLDAAKGQYITMWDDIRRLMAKGAVLLCDNILQNGDTMESRFCVERRDRTIHKRMREFLRAVTGDTDYKCDILPIGDGILIATKL